MSQFKYLFQINGPFWSVGFRPFFLFSLIFSFFALGLWGLSFSGVNPFSGMVDLSWHVHEMIFGVSLGVIAGFVLTASSHWSGVPPLGKWPLMGLVFLWTIARIIGFVNLYSQVNLVVNLSFIGLLMYLLKPYLWPKEGSGRNRVFMFLLGFLGVCETLYLLQIESFSHLGIIARGEILALGAILIIILIIGGRIIPLFTGKATGKPATNNPRLYKMGIFIAGTSWLCAGLLGFHHLMSSIGLVVSAGLLFWSYRGWGFFNTLNNSLLWSLHLGFIWVILGFLLMGLAPFISFPIHLGLHIVTLGGIGGLIYAMVSRVSLGHTGRPLKASKIVTLGYILIHAAVVTRVYVPLFLKANYTDWILWTAGLWSLAFVLLLFEYTGKLLGPRAAP